MNKLIYVCIKRKIIELKKIFKLIKYLQASEIVKYCTVLV